MSGLDKLRAKESHRIAMSMAVAGLASRGDVEIDDKRPIATSIPDFLPPLEGLVLQ